jgi:hypothetical protein
MFTGVAALFIPGSLAETIDNDTNEPRSVACFLGAVCAASTKISLVPVAVVITASLLLRLRGAARIKMGAVAIGLWLFVMGPLVIWTYIRTGSPFGAAFAQYFGRTAYQPVVLQALEDSRRINQTGLLSVLYSAGQFLNGGILALIVCGVVTCCRRWKRLAGLLLLIVLQIALIARFLPHDFRFLGGLQFGLLAAGVVGLSSWWRARIPFKWVAGASVVLLGPWFAAELYYASPFAAVVLGATTRENFLRRHVAFTDDFRALDQILPRDASLYVPNSRMPAVYAPRPVIFTVADWDGRTPVYRLLVLPSGEPLDASGLEPEPGLTCDDVVYRNPVAIVVAYRTPDRPPQRGAVLVQRCLATVPPTPRVR